MSQTTLASFRAESFGLEPRLDGGTLMIKLNGTGDLAAVEPLAQYLKLTQAEIARLPISTVEFDVRLLYFLNSSCLKAFIAFIIAVTSRASGCKVRFLTAARISWQRRSLVALQRLSPELVSIVDD